MQYACPCAARCLGRPRPRQTRLPVQRLSRSGVPNRSETEEPAPIRAILKNLACYTEGARLKPIDTSQARPPFLPDCARGSPGDKALGSYSLWAEDIEQSTVPAGTFRTLKVIMQVDADSVMKYWPAFLRRLAQPFFPKNVLYYDTAPPHHLVKFVGSFGYLAPEVTVQMTRVYIASESARDIR